MGDESEIERLLRAEVGRFYRAVQAPDRGWVGVADSDLDRAGEQLGVDLPEDLRALYRICAGGELFLFQLIEPARLAATSAYLAEVLAEYLEVSVKGILGSGLGVVPLGRVVPFAGLGPVWLCVEVDGPRAGQLSIADGKGYSWEPGAFWEWAAPSILAWAAGSADLAEAGLIHLLEPQYWPNGVPRAVLANGAEVHAMCPSYEMLQALERAGVDSGILGGGTRDHMCPYEPCASYPCR
ncbi:MAG: SMI1/KNR4 family protein [Actinomycetia bacterium]|nr:SMI1/KNR4 family protein [Actinomycetes bacterium]